MIRKNKVIASILFLIALAALSVWFFSRTKKQEVWIKNQKFAVEIADTDIKRQAGLSGRGKMCENCGMLFVFPEEGSYGFWMRGMKFNLDIVWIDGNNITYIAENVPYASKETIKPEAPADKVLELDAGTIDKLNVKVGDEIKF